MDMKEKMVRKHWLVIAVVLSYVFMLFGGGALKPDYSHISQFISELNAAGTPFAGMIAWAGFLPFGILSAVLLVAAAPSIPLQGASRIGYWLLMSQPVAYIGSALAPCDMGCPLYGSVRQMLHNGLALTTYSATAISLFLFSLAPGISMAWRAFWALLAVVWFALFAMMIDASFAEWRGLLQRLAEGIVYTVLCISAWRFLERK